MADDFQERGTPAYRMADQAFAYNSATGLVTVKQSGLYYVYSQVLYAVRVHLNIYSNIHFNQGFYMAFISEYRFLA